MTFLPHVGLPAKGRIVLYSLGEGQDLAAAAAALGLPAGESGTARLALPADGRIVLDELPVLLFGLADILPALCRRRPGRGPDSVEIWRLAALLGLRLVRSHRLAPALVPVNGTVAGVWRALVVGDPEGQALLSRLVSSCPAAAHAVPRDDGSVWDPGELLTAFLDAVADLAVRCGTPPPRAGRPRERLLPWIARWSEALADSDDPRVPLGQDAEELVAGVTSWLSAGAAPARGGAVELRLDPPGVADGSWRLELAVRRDDGTSVEAGDVWRRVREDPDDGQTGALQEVLLRGLGRAARLFPPLDAALRQAAPDHVDLDLEDAWTFLRDVAPVLADAGMVVALPPELAEQQLTLRVRVDAPEPAADGREPAGALGDALLGAGGDAAPGGQPDDADVQADLSDAPGGAQAAGFGGLPGGLLAAFRWERAVGDVTLSDEEFAELVAAKAPLVRWRERWVRVDPERVERLTELPEPGQLPLADALALALAGSAEAAAWAGRELDWEEPVPVAAGGAIAALVGRIRSAERRPPAPATPPGFSGELRPYQRRGVSWLQGMAELGLGAVLADAMGLGKTPQLIAHLLLLGGGPHLVVCPTSVVGNWEREVRRFAPDLPTTRYHGPDRPRELSGVTGVVLTTYGMLRREVDVLAEVDWDVVTLDEAQQVKNPATAGARAVRRLHSRQTVALTGTPLENRLAELWSLLDATNPGLLGSRARFGRRFVAPIEQRRDAAATRRLRRLVGPFILRREKTDPEVAADLPEKIERTVVCMLTPEQAALYQAAVDRALGDGLSGATRMQRRGRVLALLTQLKQICNHPAQYLRERADAPALAGRSGKLATAREIVAEAVAGGDQVLVFTQYVEMGRLLVTAFGAELGQDVPFLHGGLSATARDRVVAAFQGEPDGLDALGADVPPSVLVVSLRAGGTGLNLTAATHVLHYDRWWNPAVEDQATDRAHRIGQQRGVEVHKLVTAGTVEERVAELLERKRSLAGAVVGAGETWITELGDADLEELVRLSASAVGEVDDDGWDGALEEVG